jgi:mannosyltransferase
MFSVSNACGGLLAEPIGNGASFTPADFWKEDSLGGVVRAVVVHEGGNGILYHLLLHAWVRVAGAGDFAIRLPSVVMGVLTVGWTYALTRRLAMPRVAWWSASLVAIHPLLVRMSQEARPYSMAAALAVLSTLLFVRLCLEPEAGGGRGLAIGYAATAAALPLTHYLSASVLLAHLAFALGRPVSPRARRRVVGALAAGGIVAAAWLPVGGARGLRVMSDHASEYRVRAQRRGGDEGFAQPLTARTLAAGVLQVTYALGGNRLQSWGLRLSHLLPLLIVPGALVIAGWRARGALERAPDGLLLVTMLGLAPLAVSTAGALASGHVVSFQPRYASFVAPFAAAMLAFGFASRTAVARAAAVAEVALIGASLAAVYADAPEFRPASAYALAAAGIQASGTAEVVHASWPDARMINRYLAPGPLPRQSVRAAEPR